MSRCAKLDTRWPGAYLGIMTNEKTLTLLRRLYEASNNYASSDRDMPSHEETCMNFDLVMDEVEAHLGASSKDKARHD